jgi:hypothetical protein
MAYVPGDTLLIKAPESWDDRRHLFVVIAGPDDQGILLLPCLETLVDWTRDHSCILGPGDHPFIKHPSAINYARTLLTDAPNLDGLIANGRAIRRPTLEPGVLARVIEGALVSPSLAPRLKAMVRKAHGRK